MRKMMLDAIKDNDPDSADTFARNVAEVYRYDRLRLLEKWWMEAEECLAALHEQLIHDTGNYELQLEELCNQDSRNAALEEAAKKCDELAKNYSECCSLEEEDACENCAFEIRKMKEE